MKDIDTNKKVTNNDALIELMSAVEFAAGKIRKRGLKKIIFSKEIIVKQLRDIQKIDSDFNLNKNLSMSLFLEKVNMPDVKLNKASASKLLILVATTIFTEHINLLKYDKEYNGLVEFLKHFNKKAPKHSLL